MSTTIRSCFWFLAVALAVATTACDGGTSTGATATAGNGGGGADTTGGTAGTGGTGGTGGDAGLSVACESYAAAHCSQYAKCTPFTLELAWGDETSCATRERARCMADFAMEGVTATATDIEACSGKVQAQSCQAFLSELPTECTFKGTLANGAACAKNQQCQQGWCLREYGANCGTCVTPLAEGASCEPGSTVCAAGLHCAFDTCVVTPAENEPCSFVCAGLLECVNGTCTQPAGEGEPCTNGTECDFFEGLSCNFDTSVCEKSVFASAGESCADLSTYCDHESTCDVGAASPTCVPLTPDGQACTGNFDCLASAICAGNVCTLGSPECN